MKKIETRAALNKLKKNSGAEGFSILEAVAAIFIFSIVTLTIYGSFSAGLRSLAQSKHRIAATELANEKMEIIRNLPFEDVGTEGGVPPGTLPQQENIWRSGQNFNVRTSIIYADDPMDGTEGGSPNDSIPLDYKEARVEVIWGGVEWGKGVVLNSRFVPDGVENDGDGGTMRFNLIDSTGQGVADANVHIANNSTDPPVDITTLTDSSGSILLPGMPVADRTYEISASKTDYQSVTTLPPYPITAYYPADVHGSVVADDMNSKVMIFDKLGNINITAIDMNGNTLPNMDFHLEGGRVVGITAGSPTETVFGYDQNLSTDGNGVVSLSDMSPGNYTIEFSEAGYTLIGTEAPLLSFYLYPDQDINVTLLVVPNNVDSLIATVKNKLTNEALNAATVRLYDAGLTFDKTLITGDSGRVYFPPNEDPPVAMGNGNYTIEVSADGYAPFSGTININQLTQTEVELDPI